MNEKDKYLNIYTRPNTEKDSTAVIPGKMGGGYGRICWGENMLESMKRWKVNSLLDVGCGYGNFCDAASLFVPRVYGLDIASVATGNIIANPDITFLDGEAKSLPLADNAVEWITSFDCLEHCLEEDIEKILKEFDRVATKGFVLSISYIPCEADGLPLHMTVKPESWWIAKLSQIGEVQKKGRTPITGVPYLICRKPSTRKVICYCSGSLGSRLRGLAFADAVARRTQRRLTLVWPDNDPLCRIKFSDLFSNPIPQIAEDALLELNSFKIYANIKEVARLGLISGRKILRKMVRESGSSQTRSIAADDMEDNLIICAPGSQALSPDPLHQAFIKSLSPVPMLQDRIRETASRLQLDKRVMGVHARGTDFGVHVNAYANHMNRVLGKNPDQKFLVCSEDRNHEDGLDKRFRGHVLSRRKSAWTRKVDPKQQWAMNNVATSSASVTESLIDLYLLARTDFRIYHESSAFAQLAKMLSSEAGVASPVIEVPCTANATASIHYFCPDSDLPSAGIRRLYRHVDLLNRAGFSAFILHVRSGFQRNDMPEVPVRFLDQHAFSPDDIVVVPEGFPKIMHALKHHPGRRFVIALNWDYIYKNLPDGVDWREFNIERVLAVSPVIGKMIHWAMRLPVHVLKSSIDRELYYADNAAKKPRIAYIARKTTQVGSLKRMLASRNPAYVQKIEWSGLEGLPQTAYAAKIREASIFLNLSMAEGYPTSCLEAMAAGTLVAGYDSVGGRDVLSGSGGGQNSLLAPMGDYVSLAFALEPVLDALLAGPLLEWESVLNNASRTVGDLTLENEAGSLIAFWSGICSGVVEPAALEGALN